MAWTLSNIRTAVDLSAEVSGVKLAQRAYAETSRLSFTVSDEAGTLSILNEDEIQVMDAAVKAFQGPVRVKRRADRGVSTQRIFNIECQDFTTYLGDDIIPSGVVRTTVETDKARIAWLGTTYGTRGLVLSGTTIVQIRAVMPDQDFSRLTLHQALTLICAVTGGSFYVDFDKILHYYSSEALSAPFGLSDVPNETTTFGYHGLSLTDDTTAYTNEVLVVGDGVETTRYLGGSPPAAGTRRAAVLEDPNIVTLADAQAAGDQFITKFGANRQPSQIKTYRAGLKAGMTVQITHAGYGLVAVSYRIASVEAEPIDRDRIEYTISLGASPVSLASMLRQQDQLVANVFSAATEATAAAAGVNDLSAGGGNLVANSSFEDQTSWTPGASWTVGVDPVSPQEPFAGAKVARLVGSATTSDLQTPLMPVARGSVYWISAWLYCRSRTAGDVSLVVLEYNSASTLIATTVIGSIAAASTEWRILSRKFAPAAEIGVTGWQTTTTQVRVVLRATGFTGTMDIDGVQMERGDLLTSYAPKPYELIDGSITTVAMADLAISTAKLADLAITTTKITDDAVTTAKVNALAIDATKIAANAVTTAKLNALAVDATKIAANAIVAGKIAAGIITSVEMAANSITSDKIAAGAVSAGKVAAGAVHVGNMMGNTNNEAPNPGFEKFTGTINTYGQVDSTKLPGWQTVALPANMGVFNGASDKRSGANGLVYKKVLAADDVYSETVSTPAVQGRKYVVSMWVKGYAGNNAGSVANMYVRGRDAADVSVGFHTLNGTAAITVGADTAWQQLKATFTVGATSAYLNVGAEMTSAGGATDLIAFDDVELYPADYDVNQAAGNVIIDSTGVTIIGGKLTLTNAGGTVVIDGTSNMFKIVATGTTSLTVAAGVSSYTTTILTGLGTLAVQKAFTGFIGNTSSGGVGYRHLSTASEQGSVLPVFAADSSGGSPVRRIVAELTRADWVSYLSTGGSSNQVMHFDVFNQNTTTRTMYGTYYVFTETAI